MIGGNIISALSMWLITLYLVRVDALEDLGTLSLVQSLGLVFFIFCTFKLMNVQISDVEKKFSEVDYYFARIISAILCIVLIAFYMLFSNYNLLIKVCCLIYAIYYGLMIVKEYFSASFQIDRKYRSIFISNSLSGILSCLCFIAIYSFTKEITASLVGIIVGGGMCIILNHFMINNEKNIYSDFNFLKSLQLIKNNLFLGLSAVLVSGLILIPRFFIENIYGLKALGVFSAITSIMFFINIFLNSLTQVLLRETIDIYDIDKVKSYKKIVLNFLFITLIILFGLIPVYFWRNFIVVLIFGENFVNYSDELFYSIALSVFLFWFNYGNFILTIQRNFGAQVYISTIAFIAQLVLCYCLVSLYSYLGAFIAMGSTYILGFIACTLTFLWKEKK
ncbi:MATE family efflux transporter [Acinetobacter pecorum]|uniref:Polysaccharide biosynthesis protein n=1 Tax=Acinetobacter pecorum TaxID=2762215 RepID=A0ABR8VWU7_9GAMM|nr:hypothetical protein [Acinetobacter pecorum]MBD8009237.1 hypothetical protein [Acinetobacter pecorum]